MVSPVSPQSTPSAQRIRDGFSCPTPLVVGANLVFALVPATWANMKPALSGSRRVRPTHGMTFGSVLRISAPSALSAVNSSRQIGGHVGNRRAVLARGRQGDSFHLAQLDGYLVASVL